MRLPLAFTLGNRDATLDKDEFMKNCHADGRYTVKRPGLVSTYSLAAGAGSDTTIGQGLFVLNSPTSESLCGIRGDSLTIGVV